MTPPAAYLTHTRALFGQYRALAERALEQVPDEVLHLRLDDESNSLAILVRHMAGNMRSRWTDFLTTDGEKPDRQRDREFDDDPAESRAALRARWDAGWTALFDALDALEAPDLARTVTVRGEPLSVFEAIERQKFHYAYHVGQIVLLSKYLRNGRWQCLSIPRPGPRTA